MRSRALLFAAFATLTAAPLAAQNQAYVRRLDSLSATANRAEARLRAHDDSVKQALATLDTIVVGPVRMLVERRYADLMRSAAQAALDSVGPEMGETMGRVGRYLIVARLEAPVHAGDTATTFALDVLPSVKLLHGFRASATEESLRGGLLRILPFIVFYDASPELVRWMGLQIPIDTIIPAQWRRIRMDLVSAPAIVGSRCYAGDLTACARALQTVPTSDPLTQWYDGRGWRRLVRDRERLAQRLDRDATAECLDGYDLACLTVLRKFNANEIPPPLTYPGASLARLAVSLGGAGAIERMLAGDPATPPLKRLAAASRLEPEALVREWQRRVHETVAPSEDMSAEVVLVASVWTLGLGLVSLRSSRWR